MTVVYVLASILLFFVVALATLVQMFYLEALRLRSRDSAPQQFFRDNLDHRIGVKTERGAMAFSFVKHTALALAGVTFLAAAAQSGQPLWQAAIEAAVGAWVMMVASAYVIPHGLYRRALVGWLAPLVPLLRLLEWMSRPFTSALEFFESLFGLNAAGDEASENGKPAESIDALIDAGAEEGILAEEDRKLIQSVVAFGDKTVREVMTPRPQIVAIAHDKSLDDLRQLVVNEQFSRIPVYRESIDEIIGFVHVRDMFEIDARERPARRVGDVMRDIDHVPETKPVDDLLREMQEKGSHIAVVVDEYGNTAGLVTMEDLVEEILGEIRDEHEPGSDVTTDPSGAFILAGSFDVDGLAELVGFHPSDGTESTTVGGLASEWLGRVPRAGESVTREGIRIEVLAGNELRVEQVRVSSAAETKVDA